MTCVAEIMCDRLLYLCEDDLGDARSKILRFGVTAAPVLDENGRPVGIVSLRDLDAEGKPIRVSCPVVTVTKDRDVEAAARVLAETDYHHLVVVDDAGVAVGMVSAVDFLRALSGLPARHPPRFETAPTYSEES